MIVDAHCHIRPEQRPEGSLQKIMEGTADSVGFEDKEMILGENAQTALGLE